MKKVKKIIFIIILILNFSCTENNVIDDNHQEIPNIDFEVYCKNPEDSDFRQQYKGHFSGEKENIAIIDNKDTIAIVELSEPSIAAIADKEYPWGYFQFPTMGVNKDGVISIQWQMRNDSASDYGDNKGDDNVRVSLDNGETWILPPNDMNIPAFREQVSLPNGDILSISAQPSADISEIEGFPSPIFTYGNYSFYYENDLPEKYKGVYVNYFHDNKKTTIQSKIYNDNLIRYSINNLIGCSV